MVERASLDMWGRKRIYYLLPTKQNIRGVMMSIQRDRRNSLKLGGWYKLVEVHCEFLELCYQRRYYYASTQGRLLREKPLLSLGRWRNPSYKRFRDYHLETKK